MTGETGGVSSVALGGFKKECLSVVQAVWPASSVSIHTIELSPVSKADWRQVCPETLKSRDKNAAETTQAEENFNSITTNSEGKLLMIMEI